MLNKIASYIGLAQRAGAVFYGEDIIVEKLRFARVVIVDAGVDEKYKDRIKRECGKVAVFELAELTSALHRENVKAIAISNAELANAIINLLTVEVNND